MVMRLWNVSMEALPPMPRPARCCKVNPPPQKPKTPLASHSSPSRTNTIRRSLSRLLRDCLPSGMNQPNQRPDVHGSPPVLAVSFPHALMNHHSRGPVGLLCGLCPPSRKVCSRVVLDLDGHGKVRHNILTLLCPIPSIPRSLN